MDIKDMNNPDPEEIDHILTAVPQVVDRLRAMSPVWKQMEKERAS